MDMGIDPCEDFYKFSCGKYENIQGWKHTDEFSKKLLIEALHFRIFMGRRMVLNGAAEKTRDFYNSCIQNKTSIDRNESWECYLLVQNYFPDVLARLSNSVITDAREKTITQLFDEISSIFQRNAQSLFSLDFSSNIEVVQRLKNTTLIIGAPTTVLNASHEKEVYKEVSISKGALAFGSNLETLKMFNATRSPEHAELLKILTTSAFYLNKDDGITVTASGFKPPSFDDDYPDVIVYSTLGIVISREYSHAIYRYVNETLTFGGSQMKEQSLANFSDNLTCLKQSHYVLPNSKSTLQGDEHWFENFVDILGLQVAFKAFMKSFKNSRNYTPLPRLDRFTVEQAFFISAAQRWCTAAKEGTEQDILDKHTHFEFRVFIQVTNSIDFAEAFNCPSGSKYNPKLKCGNYIIPFET